MKERLSSLLKSSLALVQFTHMFCGGALYSSNTPNTVLQPGSSSAASDYIWRVFKNFKWGTLRVFSLLVTVQQVSKTWPALPQGQTTAFGRRRGQAEGVYTREGC